MARNRDSSRRLNIQNLYEPSLSIYLTTIFLRERIAWQSIAIVFMSANTIASIQCIPMRLPFHHWSDPPLFAGRPRSKLDSALVRLETQDGTVAWGESYCVEPRALQAIFEALVAPLAIGRQADDEGLLPGMRRVLHNLGRSGPVVH